MKTLKFEIEIDIDGNDELTVDQILETAEYIDALIREGKHMMLPANVLRDVQLIRVKPEYPRNNTLNL